MSAKEDARMSQNEAETYVRVVTTPVSFTPDQAREAMARIHRHASYGDGSLLSAEQDLMAACNTIISQQQALLLLNAALDDLETEVATMRNQMKAVEDELAEARADLRALCGVKS